jgi:hypothetical protein
MRLFLGGILILEELNMRLQKNKQSGVKIAIQPYPYIKEVSKGKNKSLVVLDTNTEEVKDYLFRCFRAINENPDKMIKTLEAIEKKVSEDKGSN